MSKFLPEATVIPKRILQKGLTRGFIYRGASMKSTFRAGELLYVRPHVQEVKPGDVVVFKHDGQYIVHRVLSAGTAGFVTRGDNNTDIDASPVSPDQVIGRVEINENRGVFNSVRGGWLGLWLARFRFRTRSLGLGLRCVTGLLYRLLKATKFVGRIWKPAIYQIHIKNRAGRLVKYIYRNKTVAVWDMSLGYFECQKPFDLIISCPENQ
jgi:signal peptidase I